MQNLKTKKYLKELTEFLSIPTVSAQVAHKADIKAACAFLVKKLESINFDAKILPTKGHPLVFAQNLSAGTGKPTVLVYGHYDVQSPDPLDEWISEPFKPTIRKGNIYARGATDDKGQLYTWIAAVEELILYGSLPINIKFLIEGEEEIGSTNLERFIRKNKKLLNSDVCVISDSHCLSKTMPIITYGLRGLVYLELKLRTLKKDVHSGEYGGNVINPAIVLSHIISKLKDENHKILIPGFYENVRKLSSNEKRVIEKFPLSEKDIRNETGASVVAGEKEFSVQLRKGARPTLDINGMWSGYTAEGPKTIIPATASVKISMRLVSYQNPKKILKNFESFVKSLTPKGTKLEISVLSLDEPIIMDTSSHFFRKAEASYVKTFGKKPLYELSGGSIPVTAMLKKTLDIDSILMGYGLPDDGLHSPNEKLSLAMFKKGIQTNIEFLSSF